MSREVLGGDNPEERPDAANSGAAPTVDVRLAAEPDPAPRRPDRPGSSTSTTRPAPRLLLAALLGLGAGWVAADRWAHPAGHDGPVAQAVVVAHVVYPGQGPERAVSLDVTLSDDSGQALTVARPLSASPAVRRPALDPASPTVLPGHPLELALQLKLACAVPSPLAVDLELVGLDGVTRRIPVDGAAGALADSCEQAVPSAPVLALTGMSVDSSGRLVVGIVSPTRRSTVLRSFHAGTLDLPATGLPLTVGAHRADVLLEPPQGCPAPAVAAGVPQTLDVEIDLGGPATVSLQAGRVLSRWLLHSACRSSGWGR